MKWFALLALSTGLAFAAGAASQPDFSAELNQVHAVYILPMNRGMDQYLADHLARLGSFTVVADPKKADTILTDKIGQDFENQLDTLYPPPKPPKPKVTEKAKDKDAKDADSKDADAKDGAKDQPQDIDVGAPPTSTWGHGRGNYFLVNRATRKVIWSCFLPPKNGTPHVLDQTAGKITARLKHDMQPPKSKNDEQN